MRLSKIKLAGFKSFVDPTTVHFPGNLLGVVGPNGCGKSNIIDAVRWVMGESSAKNLRGESMADVIFNGSSARKPVGTASIELIFDNSDGTIGGQYAQYAEISIRRVVSRDGTSDYFLNNTRCRRKDITHIFLGTGLGPRSYSIIEQGMISRLVEARPEELRTFLEEAAGISKYKDRRKDTEHRIRHTRENLERLTDLRDEVEKQIRHLQRQARTAERYRELRTEERQVGAELLVLRLTGMDEALGAVRARQESAETALQGALADQRGHESAIEKSRAEQAELGDAFNEVQAHYYREGSEIARLEQGIHHGKQMRQRQIEDLEEVRNTVLELRQHIERDEADLRELDQVLASLGPDHERATNAEQASAKALAEAEEARRRWQEAWDAFNQDVSGVQQAGQVERARIEQLEGQLQRQLARRDRQEEELASVDVAAMERELAELLRELEQRQTARDQARAALEDLGKRIGELRGRDGELSSELDGVRNALQQARGRMASMEALQQAALGKTDEKITRWLEGQGLGESQRLAQVLHVAPGWERAVETVLGEYLQAVCVAGIDPLAEAVGALEEANVGFFELGSAPPEAGPDTLASKVQSDHGVSSLLANVHTADDLPSALAMRPALAPGHSVVTPDGLWLGREWLRVRRSRDAAAGVIAREEEIRRLKRTIEATAQRAETLAAEHADVRRALAELESSRSEVQREAATQTDAHAKVQSRSDSVRTRLEQARQRIERLAQEARELTDEITAAEERLRGARARLEQSMTEMARLQDKRDALAEMREQVATELAGCRERHDSDRRSAQEFAIRIESRKTARESARVNLERMRYQYTQSAGREQDLQRQLAEGDAPLVEQEKKLKELLERRVDTEARLGAARRAVEELDERLRGLEQKRAEAENRVGVAREAVDEVRLEQRELSVRREALVEQFRATGLALESVRETLPEEATQEAWAERLAALGERIQRLGPINLASIDELKEQSERKEYLDSQHADLTSALETLEGAIRKIDRETRTRFKETYDRVNSGLGELFPRLFGGGHAYLELTGEDLLESGVTVMARPPGKRNSSIHLLSGGEKALTAVALVFSIFRLNPAPFCMLDEVDAPLDDANVGRFCDIVKEMSEQVQFIFITHNKTTMEMASQLAGVTMYEPGVSRLVAVDIDEAVKMAAM
ncbi:MAG: chromosome segregation protein SMC [Gammaproteobacteria bacterium]|nr:chromosome segregation protein SMC [Gammaproteobacteria bacterium]TVQ48435.1 MAG: chromosome segregation protein SMC [Gammaproteobacteria bacterium]